MMLNQTNIVDANNNKFIKAQVVSKAGSYHVHKRQSRGKCGPDEDGRPFRRPGTCGEGVPQVLQVQE